MTSEPDRTAPAVAVVVSRYNASITDRLVEGALDVYALRGGDPRSVHVFHAPGSFELPALAMAAAETGRYRGVVALGCLIRGETRHDRYIAEAVAHGLVQVSVQTGVPCGFGVLTVESGKQAKARAGGDKGNKGAETMAAVLEAIESMDAIKAGRPPTEDERSERPDKAGVRAEERD